MGVTVRVSAVGLCATTGAVAVPFTGSEGCGRLAHEGGHSGRGGGGAGGEGEGEHADEGDEAEVEMHGRNRCSDELLRNECFRMEAGGGGLKIGVAVAD